MRRLRRVALCVEDLAGVLMWLVVVPAGGVALLMQRTAWATVVGLALVYSGGVVIGLVALLVWTRR